MSLKKYINRGNMVDFLSLKAYDIGDEGGERNVFCKYDGNENI
jgi:hypothetical protein